MQLSGTGCAKIRGAAQCVVLLVSLGACGPRSDAEPKSVTVTMSEWEFKSSQAAFTAGTPYRFVLRNAGSVAHEWAVVPRGASDESQVLIEVEEDELPAGATVTTDVTFPGAGDYDFACFVPGHFEAGMRLPITIAES